MSPREEVLPDEFMEALAEANVLEIFKRLPDREQTKFTEWVDIAHDVESRWRRIDALVLALRTGLLSAR
jgi:uncharacterized protein YdeI (YjbR/CyaY-like superfamily)